jgi:hypothetical protein
LVADKSEVAEVFFCFGDGWIVEADFQDFTLILNI